MNDLAITPPNGGLMPQTFNGKYEMAKVLSQSGLIPTGLNTPEKVCVALQWGHELGLSPMVAVNNVAVINGKPTLSADIMAAVVKRSPEYGGIKWITMTDTKAECEITRVLPNGEKEVQTSCFTIEDAQKAGLAGRDVWKKYPKRMLKHRCLSYGLKDVFPDLLAGLYTPEEMENIEEPQVRNITPVEEPQVKNVTPEQKPTNFVSDNRKKLAKIVEKYAANMDKAPYEMCCKALAGDDENEINDKLSRAIAYFGRKGIEVAV